MKCAYGLSCRFLGTHRDIAGNSDGKENSEMNFFNKDTQRLLWKNKITFIKADAKLKSLGLLVSPTEYYFFTSMFFVFVQFLWHVIYCSFTPISISMMHDYTSVVCLFIFMQFLGACQKKQCCRRKQRREISKWRSS